MGGRKILVFSPGVPKMNKSRGQRLRGRVD